MADAYIPIVIPGLDERLDAIMATQEEINRRINNLAAQIDDATADIRGDIQRVKDQVARGVDPDWGPLDQRVAALQGLAAENIEPAPTPTPPTPGPATT